MSVKEATFSDKSSVLQFCKNTFSWGDYIEAIWDYWIKEKNLFVIHKNSEPIAMCHASISPDGQQIWIEGIRVNPNFRRHGNAMKLVEHCETIAKQKDCKHSFMLIETNNQNSINLSKKLGYVLKETWKFYTLIVKNSETENPVLFIDVKKKQPDELFSNTFYYVKSWRWLPLDQDTISHLSSENRIIYSNLDDDIGLATFCDSEHFDATLLVTILSDSSKNIQNMLQYIQNFAKQNDFKRIQILSKTKLPDMRGLEEKLAFHLVGKKLM